MERATWIEHATIGLEVRSSTAELHPLITSLLKKLDTKCLGVNILQSRARHRGSSGAHGFKLPILLATPRPMPYAAGRLSMKLLISLSTTPTRRGVNLIIRSSPRSTNL